MHQVIALIAVAIVVGLLLLLHRRDAKSDANKPPAWANPTVPPAAKQQVLLQQQEPPGKDKL